MAACQAVDVEAGMQTLQRPQVAACEAADFKAELSTPLLVFLPQVPACKVVESRLSCSCCCWSWIAAMVGSTGSCTAAFTAHAGHGCVGHMRSTWVAGLIGSFSL